MDNSSAEEEEMILPGSTVTIIDETSIYRGYEGCVQRISGNDVAAVSYTHLRAHET